MTDRVIPCENVKGRS